MLLVTKSTVISNILLPFALILFASGFFPYKPFLPGLATFDEDFDDVKPPAIFDKVIFMVVDALRSDFVYSEHSGFQFTQKLIRSGDAVPFTARATPPTITMPRVKAITTGSVPSFLDVILNFAESDTTSTLAHQDTWLAQLKARPGGRLVMYGDNTWLKLFPGMFERADGTTSFFVSDFFEVDKNVTRHVPEELMANDWSVMIMHYLGLDHIGHKSGPRSPHMIPKQQEMDAVVREIYTAMEGQDHLKSTLFILCGDHGMNDAGNHGGSSPGETSPALTFMSPKFRHIQNERTSPTIAPSDFQYYEVVEQSDIAPTLAGLLGFPVPLNSLGVFIPAFLPMWPHGSERMELLLQTAKQVVRLLRATFPGYEFNGDVSSDICSMSPNSGISRLECDWQRTWKLVCRARKHNDGFQEAESSLILFSQAARDIMSSAASNYNLTRLYAGAGLTGLATVISVISSFRTISTSSGVGVFFMFVMITYNIMMFGSSYVEEEQQFWYWVLSGWILYLHVRSTGGINSNLAFVGNKSIVFAILSRLTRRWNQTGQKFATEPDIASDIFPNYTKTLWLLVILTYADICRRLVRRATSRGYFSGILSIALTGFAFVFKLAFTFADAPELLKGCTPLEYLTQKTHNLSLPFQARIVFLGIGMSLTSSILANIACSSGVGTEKGGFLEDLHDILTMFLMTQSRSTNIPLYSIFRLQQHLLSSMDLSNVELTTTSLLLQYSTFFALGGSNGISSIDLSNAYNGVGSYNVLAVAILTFISNWAGPIWWVSATNCLLLIRRQARVEHSHVALLTSFVAASVLAVMAACVVLRNHLFIWTVFSPKFLYSIAWSMGQHLLVNVFWAQMCLWLAW